MGKEDKIREREKKKERKKEQDTRETERARESYNIYMKRERVYVCFSGIQNEREKGGWVVMSG